MTKNSTCLPKHWNSKKKTNSANCNKLSERKKVSSKFCFQEKKQFSKIWSKLFWIWQKKTFLQYREKEQIAEFGKKMLQTTRTTQQQNKKPEKLRIFSFTFSSSKAGRWKKSWKDKRKIMYKNLKACFFNLECEENFVFFYWHVRTRPKSCIQKGNLPY